MKFLNICTKKEFEVNGDKRVSWLNCGTMRVNDDGKKFIQLNHLPDITFFVFEQKKKEDQEE